MQILITGGTGFVGTELRNMLLKEGHLLTVITRSPGKYASESANNQRFIGWDSELAAAMEDTDVVINLAGESIFGQRWTDEVKQRIRSSRIDITNRLVEAIGAAQNAPDLMVSVSGVDYYGDKGAEIIDEDESAGNTFLAEVCRDWEGAAMEATRYGTRVALARLGVVLETGGGALQQMIPPFRFFIGGPVGSGDQFIPWIHMTDACRGFMFPMNHPHFEGPYNLCAPNPVTMNELADAIGEVLHRPSMFRVPEPVLKLVLGEAAQPVLDSHRVQPKKLQKREFDFQFEHVREALADIL